MYLLSSPKPACCQILCTLLNHPVSLTLTTEQCAVCKLGASKSTAIAIQCLICIMFIVTYGQGACVTACRKRIIQYRNERQELAACQRLQEGKESKQVQAPASNQTGPLVAVTGFQLSPTDHHDTFDLSHLLMFESAW